MAHGGPSSILHGQLSKRDLILKRVGAQSEHQGYRNGFIANVCQRWGGTHLKYSVVQRELEEDIDSVWIAIHKAFEVIPDPSCGTHIHMKPKGGFYP